MRAEDLVRIQHMIAAVESAQKFVRGRVREDLETDQMLCFALTRAVEIIGEAASRVSEDGRAEMPAIPWAVITGMRNRLVHAYFDIDLDILWDTVQLALPPLLVQLQSSGLGGQATEL